MATTLINLVIALIVAGVILYCLRMVIDLIPMDAWLKQVVQTIIWIIVILIVLFYVIVPLLHMLASQLHL
jgi:hypothetical protein